MGTLTIRNLDDQLKERLRVRAALHGRSMEEEARMILRAAIAQEATESLHLADAIHRRFKKLGGVELELPPREPMREPPKFR